MRPPRAPLRQAEGIDAAAALTYQDNSDIIALLDSKASILATLDEEVSVPRANDDTFTAKAVPQLDPKPTPHRPQSKPEPPSRSPSRRVGAAPSAPWGR